MNKESIKKYIEVIKRATSLIEKEFGLNVDATSLPEDLLVEEKKEIIKEVLPKPFIQHGMSNERAKFIDRLLNIKEWPEAAPAFAICEPTEEDKINRANSVLQMLVDCSLKDLHFLDFGCGEGYVANQVLECDVASSTGYDIKGAESWEKFPQVSFTTNFDDLKPNFYDVIFVYDVLDHVPDVMHVIEQIKSLLSPTGIIYIRCHPWTSKHATHIHRSLNKAYIHLFMSPEEMNEKGFNPMFTRQELNPTEAYKWWFHDFKIVLERPVISDVHPFFKNPTYQNLMINQQKITSDAKKAFLESLKLEFVDYVLTNW